MRWLHLTDLHIGRGREQHTTNAIHSLLDDLTKLPELQGVDCIFLTGDLAWSGLAEEYQAFEELVLGPLRSLAPLANARIFAVPGNHDLDCNGALPVHWDSLGKSRQELFFAATAPARDLRMPRSLAFKHYSAFMARRGLLGLDPMQDIASAFELDTTLGRVQLVFINTALLCDKDFPDEQQMPAPTSALREVLKSSEAYAARFVLGHHPIRWFSFGDQEPFKTLLVDNHATYLHGHIHDIEVTDARAQLLSFGFGAGYQASLDKTQPSHYRNMYAVCEVNPDGLHVFIRSWDNQHGRWIPHHQLPVQFQRRSDRFRDGFIFQSPGANPPSRQSRARVPAIPRPSPLTINRVLVPRGVSLNAKFWRHHLASLRLGDIDLASARVTTESDANRVIFNADLGDRYLSTILRHGFD